MTNSCLYYRDNELYLEKVNLKTLAKTYGTPCYVYSREKIVTNWRAFQEAFANFPSRISYAVKANSNLAILQLLVKQQAHFDIVSGGELARVLAAGGSAEQVIFSGVAKQTHEIEYAIDQGIYCFNIESSSELVRLNQLAAKHQKKINIALRLNPNVDANTHAHISTGLKENKFGLDLSSIPELCAQLKASSHLELIGIASHIGSQIVTLAPFMLALDQLLVVYRELKNAGFSLNQINLGGGLGIVYQNETPPTVAEYAAAIREKVKDLPIEILIEPGRAIVGNAGILLTQIEYLKQTPEKNFALVDAGMNDFLRPALYHAWQAIYPLTKKTEPALSYDIVGPVCESADFLAKNRELAIAAGDYLAIDTAGAYGFVMSSNYNSRPRAAEILIDQDNIHVIRRRETVEDLFAAEQLL